MIDQLRRTLRHDLPISRQLGITPLVLDEAQVILGAPLQPNRNHAGGAFAGSINALAALAGWSLVWALMRRHRLEWQVLLQDSSITYRRPVTSDFQAACPLPDPATIERFLLAIRRRGRGRLSLRVSVSDDEGLAASFSGRYVARATSVGSA